MTDEEFLLAAIHEEVALHDDDLSWPSAFSAERERLESLLPGAFIELQHIGSTAVPGMPAKPIVDILAGVGSMAEAESLTNQICGSGYTPSAEFNRTLSDRQWFMRWAAGHGTHHLHVVAHGGEVWCERGELAGVHASDREAYTNAKTEFVRSVLRAMPDLTGPADASQAGRP